MSEVDKMPEPVAWLYENPDGNIRKLFLTNDDLKRYLVENTTPDNPMVGFAIPLVSRVDYWKLAERYDEAMKPTWSWNPPGTVTQ